MYTRGQSETILGELIKERHTRERVVLATKFNHGPPEGDDPNGAGNSRKNMMQAVEASLKRLQTDYIDLYWLHVWDFTARPEEVMRGLDDLVRAGKVLYAGVSNTPAWVIAQCNTMADLQGWSPFVANQIEYSLVQRTPERELIPMSRALDIALLAWSPLGSGVLTGKYLTAAPSDEKRRLDVNPMMRKLDDRVQGIAREVGSIAKEIGRPPEQVALAWVRERGLIPILGASRFDQFKSNISYLNLTLAAEHLKRLDDFTKLEPGYPTDFHIRARGFIYGGMYDRIERHREQGIGVSKPN
jgi:aryl-alcohol dehydrogenase-like predicted oxidoreductase